MGTHVVLNETASWQTPLVDLQDCYREFPPPALRGALACLWVRVAARPTRVLPDACADLVWQAGHGAFVAGPDTGPHLSTAPPGTVIVGARFLPGAGGPALGLPLSELRDTRLDIADLRPGLQERLPADLTPAEALRAIASTAGRLATAGPPDPLVRAAARRLADPHTRVDALADHLGVSERHLRRRCHAAVGYGPKTLQRTLRFAAFLARLDAAGSDPDLARIAADSGYADQAHLTRDCTRLAGLPPAALARARAGA